MVMPGGVLGIASVVMAMMVYAPGPDSAPPRAEVLYASVGPELTWYDVEIESGALAKRASVTLPAPVQEAWPHPSHAYLYVAWSNGGPGSTPAPGGGRHGVTAFRIERDSGALHPHGPQASLRSRPVHITVDTTGAYLLAAYNDPSGLTVHRIQADGTPGNEVAQPAGLDFGVYGHQVRVDPSNKSVVLVTRGNGPTREKPEDPGALKVFTHANGVLALRASVAPGGGYGFQPRHLDYHPGGRWAFVTLERQNKLQVYSRLPDGALGAEPLFTKDTLDAPGKVRSGQAASTVHVHPNGRFVYVGNRASDTTVFEGKPVFAGGENTIAVFSIDPGTGEPTLIQNADTRGIHPRTFALDSSGRILIAANQMSLSVRAGDGVRTVPASLAVFRVRADGKLELVRAYDVETGSGRSLFWMGILSMP